MTDETGFYRIENIPPGRYEIIISCMGYKPASLENIEIYPDVRREINASLQPQPLQAELILITASDSLPVSGIEGQIHRISEKELELYRALGVEKLLQIFPGVQVESATGGGSAHIRLHGSRSSQVLVMLDGQRLNSPQTGEVDLNAIPMEHIERIELIPHGNTALYGGNAFSGIVRFVSRNEIQQNHISINGKYGSFESTEGGIKTGLNWSGISFISGYNQNWSAQDFDYRYENDTFVRENAWFQNRSLFMKAAIRKDRFNGHILVQNRAGKRGLPSSNYNEQLSYGALVQEEYRTVQLQQKIFWNNYLYSDVLAGYHRLIQTFDNAKHVSPYLRYKSRNKSANLEVRQQNYFQPSRHTRLTAGYHFLKENLKQEDLLFTGNNPLKNARDIHALFAGFEQKLSFRNPLWQSANVHGVLRYEAYFEESGTWFPTLGLNMQPKWLPKLYAGLIWARSMRYPDFNSLFWKADARAAGNPELQPERNDSWIVHVRLQRPAFYAPELQIRLFREDITDLIFWHRGFNGVWQPRNLHRAQKKGVDLQWDQNLAGDWLQWQSGYNYLEAVNLSGEPTTDGKRIVFTPEHSVDSRIIFRRSKLHFLLAYRFISERETVAYNSENTQLSAYRLWDASLGYHFYLGRLEYDADLTLKNAGNENYALIFGYPMPGREWRLSVKMKWNVPE